MLAYLAAETSQANTMSQPTVTLIASIVTVAGSTIVGVTAILASWRGSRAALRQQERLIAAEKLWERRADTYVELMKAVNVVLARAPDKQTGRVSELSDLLTADFFARLSAYDAGTVQQALSDYLNKRNAVGLDDLQRSVQTALNMQDGRNHSKSH
jgi:hypothetical protein